MRYFSKKRRKGNRGSAKPYGEQGFTDEDPMNGVANLFDVGLVFIVGLILTLFSTYRLQDMFSENSKLTIMKQAENGELEIIKKDGKKISAVKVTKQTAQGQGIRLGTAYKLDDGSMVYVPE